MTLRFDSDIIANARAALKKEKIFTLQHLLATLGCSRRTAQSNLMHWKALTSYNQNSKFYTFPEIPKFDSNGLWFYDHVAFSKNGNLKETVIHLVASSHAGLTGNEIGTLLGIPARNFVHHFKDCPGIYREKHNGLYIHFSDQSEDYEDQVKNRIERSGPLGKQSLSTEDAIMILVALIKNGFVSLEEIVRLPEVKSRGLSDREIKHFLNANGLLKKNGFRNSDTT